MRPLPHADQVRAARAQTERAILAAGDLARVEAARGVHRWYAENGRPLVEPPPGADLVAPLTERWPAIGAHERLTDWLDAAAAALSPLATQAGHLAHTLEHLQHAQAAALARDEWRDERAHVTAWGESLAALQAQIEPAVRQLAVLEASRRALDRAAPTAVAAAASCDATRLALESVGATLPPEADTHDAYQRLVALRAAIDQAIGPLAARLSALNHEADRVRELLLGAVG